MRRYARTLTADLGAFAVGALAALLVGLLVACGSVDDGIDPTDDRVTDDFRPDEPTGTVPPFTPSEPEAPLTAAEVEGVYLLALHTQEPTLTAIADGDLVDLGYAICTALDTGSSFEVVAAIGLSSGMAPEVNGTIIGGAVAAFCPDHTAEAVAWAERWS